MLAFLAITGDATFCIADTLEERFGRADTRYFERRDSRYVGARIDRAVWFDDRHLIF